MASYVYKYEADGEIIYIGKTIDLKQRVEQHAAEEKFQAYPNAKISYFECGNDVEMSGMEKLFINAYKPRLNEADVMPGIPMYRLPEVVWTDYEMFVIKSKIALDKNRITVTEKLNNITSRLKNQKMARINDINKQMAYLSQLEHLVNAVWGRGGNVRLSHSEYEKILKNGVTGTACEKEFHISDDGICTCNINGISKKEYDTLYLIPVTEKRRQLQKEVFAIERSM